MTEWPAPDEVPAEVRAIWDEERARADFAAYVRSLTPAEWTAIRREWSALRVGQAYDRWQARTGRDDG